MAIACGEAVLPSYGGYAQQVGLGYGGYSGYRPAVSHAEILSPVVADLGYGGNPHGYGGYGSYGAYGGPGAYVNGAYGHGLNTHDSYVSFNYLEGASPWRLRR